MVEQIAVPHHPAVLQDMRLMVRAEPIHLAVRDDCECESEPVAETGNNVLPVRRSSAFSSAKMTVARTKTPMAQSAARASLIG